MNDENRIIILGNFGSRQRQRAGLVDTNKRLVREVDLRNRTIREQAGHIKAMNAVFTDIATLLKTPVPTSAAEGPAALTAMLERIAGLVKNEKAGKKEGVPPVES